MRTSVRFVCINVFFLFFYGGYHHYTTFSYPFSYTQNQYVSANGDGCLRNYMNLK